MVAPIYTWKPAPPEAPSCATCKHYRFKKGFPIFGVDKHLCSHPKAVHKITGALADANMVRWLASQDLCNVEGRWWEDAVGKAVPPAVFHKGRASDLPGRMPGPDRGQDLPNLTPPPPATPTVRILNH